MGISSLGSGRPVPEGLWGGGSVRGWSRGTFGLDSRFPAVGWFAHWEGGVLPLAGRMAVDGGLEFADAPEQVLLPVAVALLEFLVAPAVFSLYLRVAPSVGCEDLARLPGFPWVSAPSRIPRRLSGRRWGGSCRRWRRGDG